MRRRILAFDSILFLFFIFVTVYVCVSLVRIISTFAPDFSVYYYSTIDLLHDINPYTDRLLFTKYTYPPFTNILYIPLSILPYNFAQAIYVVGSAVAVIGSIILSDRLLFRTFLWKRVLLFLSFAFLAFPVKFTLSMGQSNAIAYCFLIIGYDTWKTNRKVLAGIFLGIAILLKPPFAFILVFFLVKRAYKTLITVAGVILTAVVILIAMRRFHFLVFYIQHEITPLMTQVGRGVYYNQSIEGFVGRLPLLLTQQVIMVNILTVLVLVCVGIVLLKTTCIEVQFAFVIAALPLIHTLSWQHHFLILIFPFLLAFKLSRSIYSSLFLLGAYLLVSSNIKVPAHVSFFILSHTFYGVVLLLSYLFTISFQNSKTNKKTKPTSI